MYNRFVMNFVNSVTKFYSKVFIHQAQYKLIGLQCNFSIRTSALITRGYNTIPSNLVYENYEKQYQQDLDNLLQEPKYKTMYDKYKLEVEYAKNFYRVPEKLTSYNWLILMRTPTRSQRRKYLEFLWKLERKHENQLRKKNLKALERSERPREDDDCQYGLSKVSLFHRIREKTIIEFLNGRLINAILFEPTIVFDLGYDEIMTPYEQFNCAKQLLLSFSYNRAHNQPFNLYFCNISKDSVVMQKLHRTIPSLYNEDFPLNVTSKSYLDIFNKKKLVYLTPHAKEVMKTYDPNLVYIIGALVDKVNPRPYTFEKAHSEGIRMMKFPLSQNLEWGRGSGKSLPLNQVISILLEFRYTGNWTDALTQIPKRKLKEAREYQMEQLIIKRQKKIDFLQKKK